ncbi:DNA topoisomerase (ATP-hydrolyzing) subunit B [Peptoniphilus harei]|uniref:DNA gyrase subunit B n=1 Tax=Peptoniphilus harei TaxID=54005 RepID=A0A2X1YHI3_9FIRM|nr:DNA topoisomerase (ATP-hydrolyzing) subunit B [Peptoniphilus harei]MBS6535186.1 DNA topoisomerase (ATP-hydrolyzing) subunit B [Peptoniphilus harei]MDU3086904.1 DNA topoisomerase (ATP-hydrolyzing) subunit B [Peptoniphilus harei]MDU5417236.1 DNA topoisomerase (ATP-hydrolyzing) subunit B [Peptoniphilus harei]MDU5470593.1 DNA topoisomerase (ATP-hydrolyzing) subunit B [Peptoniphilus harei]MDU6743265.1 DNA topoisomerase (ATP-hydrolyzing) subunit B [Peptoniphilus harei]
MAKDKRHYDASDIQVLEGLDPVRKRPGMYIGSTGPRGLHHLVYEVVDNSIDEALAGICDHIIIKINKNGSVEITDNGSGIPVDIHPQTGKSTVETVLTILHAGGKFDNSAYKVSGGLHGVGVSVVNALSNKLVATVKRNGKIYRQEFSKGHRKSDLEVIGETKKDDTGTTIYFEPDDTIFETVEFSDEVLSKRFREMAFLNKGIKIEFIDERKDLKEVFHYEGGIKSFVEFINAKKKPVHDEIIYIDEIREETAVEIAIQYTDSYSEVVLSFANNINTEEGGTHLSGFRSALTRTLNDYGRKNNIIKEKEENLSGEDVREGISAVISVKLPDPQFEGQTKAKLGNSETRGVVDSVLSEELAIFLEENPRVGKQILDKALSARRAREAARKARDLTRKKNNLESMTLPGKLADCQNDDPKRNEIFLVEGNSAGGSAKDGRDSAYQAILPLRGKIMNVEKARLDRMLNSSEIRAMITAFGTGIGEEFNLEKLRYDKIIIMTDADVDGAHIMTLLLTFFFRYMKPLIEEGHVYVAQAPLYGIEKGTKILRYCHNEKELRLALKEYKDSKVNIKRYKGLGEMDPEQLWETTMNPDNRLLLKVNIDDLTEADDTFSILMGSEVEPRRDFITENAVYADYIDA